ncbi:hypothetical protein EVAR_21518_1 [Eumeta japonica]|uniref:Uncharacterized protein n=1 Tax=Eumeta variegata TaxID=151549 RepID=A0A4C1UXP8_EUMVA|nr:hypothetical protein EVAR_21518_1 [Eumeta japonica]
MFELDKSAINIGKATKTDLRAKNETSPHIITTQEGKKLKKKIRSEKIIKEFIRRNEEDYRDESDWMLSEDFRCNFKFLWRPVRTVCGKSIRLELNKIRSGDYYKRAISLVECSALERVNMNEVFEEAVRAALKKKPVNKRVCHYL